MDPLIAAFSDKVNYRNFNPGLRDDFIKEIASNMPPNSKILDVSSGNKPYMNLFSHCIYTSHEFSGNINILDGSRNETDIKNKKHDIYSDINNIPVESNSFDLVLCTEVFEHIPEPIRAMMELVRICKPSGRICITAPFTSGIHQEPYHFYSGFSPYFYNYLKRMYNLNIIAFKSQGDNFLLNHQEIGRCLQHRHTIISSNAELSKTYDSVINFLRLYTLYMSDSLKNELDKFNSPEKMLDLYGGAINNFTIGYCVLFEKL
jgi:ubiquinone/menaquinone biosynthesis C-methylase UbiE